LALPNLAAGGALPAAFFENARENSMETLGVKNLMYRQVWLHPHGHRVKQEAPPPQPFRIGVFDASFEDGRWTFTPIEDFYSEEDARTALEPCLRVWEIEWDFDYGLRVSFEFATCNMEQSKRGAIGTKTTEGVLLNASSAITYTHYPSPPALRLHGSALAQEVRARWHDIEDNPKKLLAGANLFLSTLENLFGGKGKEVRKEAAYRLNVESEVLGKLGELSARNDDRYSSKNKGPVNRLTEDEEVWIRKAVPMLAKRIVEIESGLVGLRKITMNGLPSLNFQ
jgi:hypothetical protein